MSFLSCPLDYLIDTDHNDLHPVDQPQEKAMFVFPFCWLAKEGKRAKQETVCKECQRPSTGRRDNDTLTRGTTGTTSFHNVGYMSECENPDDRSNGRLKEPSTSIDRTSIRLEHLVNAPPHLSTPFEQCVRKPHSYRAII
jgi:hypothetical protein